MESKETIKYLIKYYNAKRLRDKKFGRIEKLKKDEQITEALQNLKKDVEQLEEIKEIYSEWLIGKTSDFEIMKQIFEVLEIDK